MKKIMVIIFTFIILLSLYFILFNNKTSKEPKEEIKKIKIGSLLGKTLEDAKKFTNNIEIEKVESNELEDTIIEQNKEEIKEDEKLKIKIATPINYNKLKVNELGLVPIMMYHGIVNIDKTNYIGGNVDKDGYNRTSNAFRKDLEFYYNEGYKMIRLTDYVDGIIDVKQGYSPLILTFDDGHANNIKVTGLDKDGEIIIDPNSAVGILEKFKNDYNTQVTATFFLNGGLFNQPEYNEKIIKWLIKNGYDIGNHTNTHVNFSNVDINRSIEEVGIIYEKLEKIIPNKYVNIVALPFGSPYNLSHSNFSAILKGNYNNKEYTTKSTLRVGWESELSPFHMNFNKTFLKRIRAYDNNGKEFDIQMNFNILKNKRYISDGNKNIITVPDNLINTIKNDENLYVRSYPTI